MGFSYTISQPVSSNLQNMVMRILDKKRSLQNFEVIMFDDTFIVTTEDGTFVLNVVVKYGSANVISEMILSACNEWIKHNS